MTVPATRRIGQKAAGLRRHMRQTKRVVATLGITVLMMPLIAFGEMPLRVKDPNASFLDVQARRKELQNAKTPRLVDALAAKRSCTGVDRPAPPPYDQDIPSRYKSESHGEVNPKEHALSEPYYRVQDVAAWGANRYLSTGDAKEAVCVIDALLPWAQNRALLNYNAKEDMVVWFQATWTVASLSLAVSVIRAEPTLDAANRDKVIAWLHQAAVKAVNESRGPRSGTEINNHLFWRGLAATAAGVISGDSDLYAQGLRIYATAIDEIDAQGAFPAEMKRHELALHYQAFAIEPLVMIAELAHRQGVNLYGLQKHGRHLSDAVSFLSKAIANSEVAKKYASEPQQLTPDLQPGSQLLAWVEFWEMRGGGEAWQWALTKPLFTARLSGSTTLYAAPLDKMPTQGSASKPISSGAPVN